VRSAAIELQEPNTGAVRVKTGAFGVVDRRIQTLDLGLQDVERLLELHRRLEPALGLSELET
jgi:hypothetical protein